MRRSFFTRPLWLVLVACSLPAVGATSGTTALQSLVDGAKASQSDTLMVVHDGNVLVDYRRPGAPVEPIDMMSSTKSLVAIGVGRLLTQGKLRSLDQPVSDFYPEWKQGNKARITVRMLLNHTSGIQNVPNTSKEIYPAPDGIQLALAAELSDPPGSTFSYNNKAMNLIAGIFEKAAGMPMDVYIDKEVLAPLGIKAFPWGERDRAGHPFAMSGWMAMPGDAIKVGQLVLDEGRWKGKQLIDAGYMRQMTAKSQPFTNAYGLLWWRRPAELKLSAAGVEQLRTIGIDPGIVDKIDAMRGQVFGTGDAFYAAVSKELGADANKLFAAIRKSRMSGSSLFEPAPIVAWEANGYLGNYIVIVPKARLVAVRQIAPRADVDESRWPYGYDDFTHRVVEQARTYNADLAIDGSPIGAAEGHGGG